jgi:hypothetical protein
MPEIVVLVPVLDRPHRAGPLVESILGASVTGPRILFLCTPGHQADIDAALATGVEVDIVPWQLCPGDYARKINYGINTTSEEWIFQAADDLRFQRGWDISALTLVDGRPHIGVVGTNDLGNPLVMQGRHATHSLIHRAYVEEWGTIDEPGKALHEGYHHCWVDNELVETAASRNAWASATQAVVEHEHWIWHKGSDDATYQRGQERYSHDHALFKRRRPLWRKRR